MNEVRTIFPSTGHLAFKTWTDPPSIMLLSYCRCLSFPSGSVVKNLPAMQETQETRIQSLGQEDPLKKEMATHSSILAWNILWTEEPGGLQSMGLQRIRHDWTQPHTRYNNFVLCMRCPGFPPSNWTPRYSTYLAILWAFVESLSHYPEFLCQTTASKALSPSCSSSSYCLLRDVINMVNQYDFLWNV